MIAMHYVENGARDVELFEDACQMNDWLTAHPTASDLRSYPVNDLQQLIVALFDEHDEHA